VLGDKKDENLHVGARGHHADRPCPGWLTSSAALGPGHPDTLAARDTLADRTRQAGADVVSPPGLPPYR